MRRFVFLIFAAAVWAAPSFAFPWMVKHDYQSCVACHVDPSGAGQLTTYGRAQSDVLLRWKISKPKPEDDTGELPKSARFLWFLEMPEFLNLSGNSRSGVLIRPGQSAGIVPLIMATDLYATVNVDRFVFHATTGVGIKNAERAAIAPLCDLAKGPCGVQWIAREYWAGAKFLDDAVMVRLGRLNLPFGLRNNEHTMWVRQLTRTDTNISQQVGLSISYNGEKLRGELMGIAGNLQVAPDAYRERGYSAFAEYTLAPKAFLGLSSLITLSRADLLTGTPLTRQVHGASFRWSPIEMLSLLAEADLLVFQSPGQFDKIGFASMLQADFEVVQGIHLMATAEGKHEGAGERGPSLGAWGSVAWYALPHLEIRVDTIYRRVTSSGVPASGSFSILAQLHFFL